LQMSIRKGVMIALASGLVFAPAFAVSADIVKSRIDSYRELGAAFKAVNDGLRGGDVQAVLIAQSARQIRNAAKAQYQLFPAGSGPRAGVKTNAKAEIWTKPKPFRAAQDAFSVAADRFYAAATKGSPATIRAEAAKLGATCKACHDQFRSKVD